jgi:hypothetical protein
MTRQDGLRGRSAQSTSTTSNPARSASYFRPRSCLSGWLTSSLLMASTADACVLHAMRRSVSRMAALKATTPMASGTKSANWMSPGHVVLAFGSGDRPPIGLIGKGGAGRVVCASKRTVRLSRGQRHQRSHERPTGERCRKTRLRQRADRPGSRLVQCRTYDRGAGERPITMQFAGSAEE